MSTLMNNPTVSATTYVAPADYSTSEQAGTAEKAAAEQASPNQPLPGSSVTLSALWRLLEESNKKVAEALSQTGAANSEAKKSLIDIQRDSTVASIRKQSEELQEQQKANKKRGIFAKIGMALGVLAAVVSAVVTFGATAAAVAVAVVAVTLAVLPTVVDKVLEKCGVPEEKRSKIRMGLEIGCAIAGLLIAFNPAKLLSGLGTAASKVLPNAVTKAATKAATEAAELASKVASKAASTAANAANKASSVISKLESFSSKMSEMLTMLKSFSKNPLISKAKNMLDDVLEKIQDLAKSEKMATRGARLAQATEVTSTASDIVGAGFGIKSSKIAADMEKAQAEQDALQTAIQQILLMLSQAMRAVTHAFETLFDLNKAHRDFNDKMISIHM
ncbi:type III secretion system translocon subunit SctE [Vibrio aquimaris]|uniref:Secretion system effector C (SseC) like family protein n=1 Tax=Vibrio aquimaris TaxID=2587862 RepID=A0A5P9CPN2_9VIBR|nr:type III secretion system translocon subunit SctE [Vibrio aquimaris]QFT28205.1 Secretion system effector C (SseC) like family protein [Vibrio aquimaris]